MTITEHYYQELRTARLARGLTQDQVAAGVGISKTMVQRYEMGPEKSYNARPSPATAMKIEAFFGRVQPLNYQPVPDDNQGLQDFSLDDLLEEIKRRGFQVTLQSRA